MEVVVESSATAVEVVPVPYLQAPLVEVVADSDDTVVVRSMVVERK